MGHGSQEGLFTAPLGRATNFWEATTGGDIVGSRYYVVPLASSARPSPIPLSFHNGLPKRGIDHDLPEPLVEGVDVRGQGVSL